jgi:kynurenine 3-monooxygenase
MFIAIPSSDLSFTCTLFMPASHFDDINTSLSASSSISATTPSTSNALSSFFEQNFPGVLPFLISPTDLLSQYKQNPHLPLISIKTTPYHYRDSCVILGDAAHAMVPFYGQGMNAGLEDVCTLFSILDGATHPSREAALAAYTQQRTPDAHAINDLAMRNYSEMNSAVRSPLYKVRKWVEEGLDKAGLGWETQYARVSFGGQRYSHVVRDVDWQGRMLERIVVGLGVSAVAAVGLGAWSRGWVKGSVSMTWR